MRLLEILIMTLAGVWQGVRQDFNLLEVALVAAGWWAWKKGWRPRWPRLSPAWTRRPALTALALVCGVIGLRLALIPVLPVPVPLVSDEFSHLLLADTLAHGRLANPTHPFWQHFESLHIIQQPHYVSNYFPGQALFLAAGIVALHSAWAGVLAGCAFFLLALYWALRGWMPARWALFGMLLAALRFGIASYWVNAYHGGFVPAAGGALVLGAFERLRRSPSLLNGAALGAGLAILATTRPFEGVAYAAALPGGADLAVPCTCPAATEDRSPRASSHRRRSIGIGRLPEARYGQPVRHRLSDQPEDLRLAGIVGLDHAATHPTSPPRDGELLRLRSGRTHESV